jgi:hypothetical protein
MASDLIVLRSRTALALDVMRSRSRTGTGLTSAGTDEAVADQLS